VASFSIRYSMSEASQQRIENDAIQKGSNT